MAIAFVSKSNNITGSNNTSGTIDMTGVSLVTLTLSTTAGTVTVTIGGNSMTSSVSRATIDGGNLYIFTYINSGLTGSQTVAITKSDGGSRAQAVGYSGAGSIDAVASGGTTLGGAGNFTIVLTVVASGCWVIATAENNNFDPDSEIIVTTDRGTQAGIKNGATQDSGGTVSTGTNNVGYHWPGATTAEVVCLSIAPTATASANGNFLMFM